MSNITDNSPGLASDSIGGTERVSNQQAGAGADSFDNYPSQSTDPSYSAGDAAGGTSAGYDNNIERSYGDDGQGEGKKSTMQKIKEKLTPGVKGITDSGDTTKHAASFGTDTLPGRHGQANADLNRE